MANKISQQDIPGAMWSKSAVTTIASPAFRVWTTVLVSIAIGLILAILWSPTVADDAIGENIANTILGSTAKTVAIGDTLFGIAFAIAAGLGTTFTACNCVVFSCIAPLTKENGRANMGIVRLLLWMCLGVITITTIYGILGVILGNRMPSLSQTMVHLPMGIYPLRLLQSTIVFVCLGIVLLLWGGSSLRITRNALTQRYPWLVPLGLGVIIGCFTVGRPYPLFHKLFLYSAGTGNLVLSAVLVAIQGLGNIALMALIFVLLSRGTRGRFAEWLQANPLRARTFTAISMIGGGTFLLAYWGLRVPAAFGIGWFPHL
jgi:hypothetical protein